MVSPDEKLELYNILLNKLCDLDVSLELSDLIEVWNEYLRLLGIRRAKAGCRPENGVYMMADPICPTKGALLIPRDAVEKILFVGLP